MILQISKVRDEDPPDFSLPTPKRKKRQNPQGRQEKYKIGKHEKAMFRSGENSVKPKLASAPNIISITTQLVRVTRIPYGFGQVLIKPRRCHVPRESPLQLLVPGPLRPARQC